MKGWCILIILLILPFVYSEEINIPETFKSENVQITSYFYTGDKLVASKDLNGIKYYSQDRLGSNRLTTDSNSNQIGETKTLPFGEEIVNDNKFSFTGKELDSELYYFGARYYDASTGRFTSVDPVASEPDYQYVHDSPMNYIDPDGNTIKLPGLVTMEANGYEVKDTLRIVEGLNKLFGNEIFYINEHNNLQMNPAEFDKKDEFYLEKTRLYDMFKALIDSSEEVQVDYYTDNLFKYEGKIIVDPRFFWLGPYGQNGQEIKLTPTTTFVHEANHAFAYIIQNEEDPKETSAMLYENYARKILGIEERVYYGAIPDEEVFGKYLLLKPQLHDVSSITEVDIYDKKYLDKGYTYLFYDPTKDYENSIYSRKPWNP